MKKQVLFEHQAFEHLMEWHQVDRKMAQKIHKLIQECLRHPFEGTGKPERLKHQGENVWSRRIDREHRLGYSVQDELLRILSCRGHYED